MKKGVDMQWVREWLQYVPQFSGKTFAFDIPWLQFSDIEKAEFMMDVARLQCLSVKMLLSVETGSATDFENWAIDFDFKLAKQQPLTQEEVLQVLNRGQAALVERSGGELLDASFREFVAPLRPAKVIGMLQSHQAGGFSKGSSLSLKNWLASKYVSESYYSGVTALLEADVPRVHLLDASEPGVLLSELFSSEGAGLMVYRNNYRLIRKIQSDDIPDLLTLIGRSVRNSRLVPRLYEDIEKCIEDYYVYEIDGNVVGCVALHTYADAWAEVACLYVKKGHEGRGYGYDLVRYAEKVAKQHGVVNLFALTSGAADFFSEKLEYQPMETSSIPQVRWAQLQQSGRDSKAFLKLISKNQ